MRRVAVLLATGVLATACGAGAPAERESVPACTGAAVQALERHVTLTTVPAPCRGLNRAQLNLALGRAIYEDAGAGQHKAAWRRRVAEAEAHLARLIKSPQRPAPRPRRRPIPAPPPAAGSRWGTGLATLAAWLLTMGIGVFMLVPWIRRGGLHPPPGAHRRLGPAITLGHASAASAGLLVWIGYLATGLAALAWVAVGGLLAVIWLGMATLAVWTASRPWSGPPGPAPVTEGPASAPPGPAPAAQGLAPALPHRARGDLRIIIPVVHGVTASATILLALLTVLGAR